MRPDLQPLDIPAGAHAYTTLRSCSFVSAPYDGWSLCTYSGDDDARTASARYALARRLGTMPERIVSARQTHSCEVATIDTPAELDGVDGIVCATPGITVGVHTADCVPIVMFAPEARVIAAVHSGWRGTVGRIAARAVDRMKDAGASPGDIHAAMGPCICTDCFEVGAEVAAEFVNAGLSHCIACNYGEKPHINLPEAVKSTLIAAGVRAENIKMPVGCSRCHPELYFSARCLGVSSGRTFTFISLD